MNYLQKVFDLIKKISNFPSFIYQVHHYMKANVPIKVARIIQRENEKDLLGSEEIILKTYDGSNQVCHPDIVQSMNKIWLAFTPYPYGKDEYENPCVYFGKDLKDIINECRSPIDKIKYREYGYHLSDPCIVDDEETIICFYRVSKRIASGKELNTILYRIRSDETGLWSDAIKICEDSNHQYLSPAIVIQDNEWYCYFAEWNTDSSALYYGKITNDSLIDEAIVNIDGMPDGYGLWHMTIVFSGMMNKNSVGRNDLTGLFLLRYYKDPNKFKLVVANSSGIHRKWAISDEIKIPDKIEKIARHPYKSCFCSNGKQILLSFIDYKDRYRLAVIER